ncbi:11192_t:CDS:2 [Acaulospora morrowiae]|uniref:11192_t:CDS:1 n=1 Tax=Acaulospora morrowiae TaxID=94023 RepID=A0A9N9AX87_9GLOM|nr:11192_t:CDS:2 [Acaulospora morrowiae]
MSFFESSRHDFPTSEAFKNTTDLSKPVQKHLLKVYATLSGLTLIAALGSYAHITGSFLFGGGVISFLVGMASLVGILSLPDTPDNRLIRYGLLANFGFMEGLSIGPVIKYALAISFSDQIILNACFFTAAIFGCFSMSSLLSNKRMFIYVGGILASVLSMLLWTSFINSFIGSKVLYNAELYIGLLMFCGYVIYDTQLIIYRFLHMGSTDVVGHTLDLFIDLVGIFVRILLIMLNKSEKEERRRRIRRN